MAFTNDLKKGKFLFSLYKNDPKTMSEVLYRATKYMNAEDALLAREERPKRRERQEDTWQDQGRKKARTGDRMDERHPKSLGGKFMSFTQLTAPIDQVLMQIKDEEALMFPRKLKSDPTNVLGISIAVFTATMVTIRLIAMTLSSRLRPLSDKENCRNSLARRKWIHPCKTNTSDEIMSDRGPR